MTNPRKKNLYINDGGMRIPDSDDDEAYESTEKEEKPIVKKVIEKGPIQSFDVSGPDICEILKKRYDYTVFPESNYEHFHKGDKYFCLSLDIATVRLTGIKITTRGPVNGFIVYRIKSEPRISGKLLERDNIFSSKNESLSSNSRIYVYPVNSYQLNSLQFVILVTVLLLKIWNYSVLWIVTVER